MAPETFLALALFAFVTSITPGPNNLMLLSSGVNFGFRRTIPHMLGIGAGFTLLLLGVGAGLGGLLATYPSLHMALKVGGGLYMLYLAWKLAFSQALDEGRNASGKPLRFMEALAFQWINPKGWIMAVSGMAIYADPQQPVLSVVTIALIFGLINLPCVSTWAVFGMGMKRYLTNERRLRIFNMVMGVMLALSLFPMLQ